MAEEHHLSPDNLIMRINGPSPVPSAPQSDKLASEAQIAILKRVLEAQKEQAKIIDASLSDKGKVLDIRV